MAYITMALEMNDKPEDWDLIANLINDPECLIHQVRVERAKFDLDNRTAYTGMKIQCWRSHHINGFVHLRI